MYSNLVSNVKNKPTFQIYFEKIIPKKLIKWDKIYLPPQKITCNTYLRCFQYKILNNTLYLNKNLYIFKLFDSPPCSFCKTESETSLNVFHFCTLTRRLCSQLQLFLQLDFTHPDLLPQAAMFGFPEEPNC